jgi:hypothetical protein
MVTPLLPASAHASLAAPLSSTSLLFLRPASTFASSNLTFDKKLLATSLPDVR